MDNNIKMAYCLLAHSNAKQINMYVAQLLNAGECEIFIHIDKKSEEIRKGIIIDERVHTYCKYNVRWGSFEIVEAGIFLMNEALKKDCFSHIYFGTGQDYMVRNGLYDHLKSLPQNLFIKIEGKEQGKEMWRSQFLIRWPKWLMKRGDLSIERFIRIGMSFLCKCGINWRKNQYSLEGMEIYHGHTWFIIPVKAARYIISFIDCNPGYSEFWRESLAPDLLFFHTIIMNSEYSEFVKDELMYVEFGDTFTTWNHPKTIIYEDIQKIEMSQAFFARKFDMNTDKKILQFYTEKANRYYEKKC